MKISRGDFKADRFVTWLRNAGVVEQKSNNSYELIRFTCSEGLGIVYTSDKGHVTLQGAAITAYSFFKAKKTWVASILYEPWQKPEVREALLKRDGGCCLYCGAKMPEGDITIEHILSLESGGNNSLDNLALAHSHCNTSVGSLPVALKIQMLLKMREGL